MTFCSKSRKLTSLLHSLVQIVLELIPQGPGVACGKQTKFFREIKIQDGILILVTFL